MVTKKEINAYRFGTTWGWVIVTECDFFGVNYPFNCGYVNTVAYKSSCFTYKDETEIFGRKYVLRKNAFCNRGFWYVWWTDPLGMEEDEYDSPSFSGTTRINHLRRCPSVIYLRNRNMLCVLPAISCISTIAIKLCGNDFTVSELNFWHQFLMRWNKMTIPSEKIFCG